VAVTVDELPCAAFTMLRNCWLRDGRIGYKAKGLLGYLRSHAAGYKCSQAQMVRESDDGRAAVRAALDELDAAGYLERVPARDGGRYAETDYRMRDPFDAEGKLRPGVPETSAAVAARVQKILQGRKSDMVTVSDFPTQEIAPIEEQGEKNTPAPTEQGATGNGDGRHLVVVDGEEEQLRGKLAQTIAAEHYEATGKLGGNRGFLAVRGIVARALEVGHGEQQLRAALGHLRGRGRPVTNSTLGPLLADPRTVTSGAYGPRQHVPTDPDAHRGAF
jgi:hypothetical protein